MSVSPFSKFATQFEKKGIFMLLPLLIGLILVMHYFDTFLVNIICKNGIVSFELAKDLNTSAAILHSWNEQAKIAAGLSMGFDFLFLITYSSFIALLIYKLNRRLWKVHSFYCVGNILIWSTLVMGLADSIENIALIKLLLGDLQQHWSSIAYYFAMLKFSILLICVLYIVCNSVYLLVKKIRK